MLHRQRVLLRADLPEGAGHQDHAQQQDHRIGAELRIENALDAPGKYAGKQHHQGQEQQHLPQNRQDRGVAALSDRLEEGDRKDQHAVGDVGREQNPQHRRALSDDGRIGDEHGEHRLRRGHDGNVEQRRKDRGRGHKRLVEGADPAELLRAVVRADRGLIALADAPERNKGKGLQTEGRAEDRLPGAAAAALDRIVHHRLLNHRHDLHEHR